MSALRHGFRYAQPGGRVFDIEADHREWIDLLVARDRLLEKVRRELDDIRNGLTPQTTAFATAQRLYAVLVEIDAVKVVP